MFRSLNNRLRRRTTCKQPGKRGARANQVRLVVETLEDRLVQSATPGIIPLDRLDPASVTPVAAQVATAPDGTAAIPLFTTPWYTTDTVYSPAQIRVAYGFTDTHLDGSGQTIAIVVAHDETTIQSDLKTFDQLYHLKDAPSLTVFKQWSNGAFRRNNATELNATPPTEDDDWAREAALDVEWAHAIAPGAKLVLVEAQDSSSQALFAAVNFAKVLPGVSVVSMSWGQSEFQNEASFNSTFRQPGVTFVSGSGDHGGDVLFPAANPTVLAVGGTRLTLGPQDHYGSEVAWEDGGGGVSAFEPAADFQKSFQTFGKRTEPDVAYNGSSDTRFQVYCEAAAGFWTSPGFAMYGVSAGIPQWAGLFALVNQGRANQGKPSLANAVKDIYSLPAGDFHDVVEGNNTHLAHAGYDLATGRGTPKAALIINALIKFEPKPSPVVGAVLGTMQNSTTSTARNAPPTYVGPILALPMLPDIILLGQGAPLTANPAQMLRERHVEHLTTTRDKASLLGHEGTKTEHQPATFAGTQAALFAGEEMDLSAGWDLASWLKK